MLSTSISFDRVEVEGTKQEFWTTFGNAILESMGPRLRAGISIKSRDDFFSTFAATACDLNIVLLIDELSDLSSADPSIRDDFLRTLRAVRDSNDKYAIRSVVAAGTFSILHLNTTNPSFSPFNAADHVINTNFTEDETLRLFTDFARDRRITFQPSVLNDIWLQSNGCVSAPTGFVGTHFCLVIPAWFASVDAQFPIT